MDVNNLNLGTNMTNLRNTGSHTENKKIDFSTTTKTTTTNKIEDTNAEGAFDSGSEKKSFDTTEKEKMAKKIDALLEDINEKLKPISTEVSYELHDTVNRYIITVKNKESGEVIKEVPSKEIIDVFAKILESAGFLFDKKS